MSKQHVTGKERMCRPVTVIILDSLPPTSTYILFTISISFSLSVSLSLLLSLSHTPEYSKHFELLCNETYTLNPHVTTIFNMRIIGVKR